MTTEQHTCCDVLKSQHIKSALRSVRYVGANITNQFINQVALMLDMMPEWANVLSALNQRLCVCATATATAHTESAGVYGHYTFVDDATCRLSVHLTIASDCDIMSDAHCVRPSGLRPQADARERGKQYEHTIVRDINKVFNEYGCSVHSCQIVHLDDAQRYERYHNYHIHHPLDNQRYQLFLLALGHTDNWNTYTQSVDDWELTHFMRRYFHTHIGMMLETFRDDYCDADLDRWTYVFMPWIKLEWSLVSIRALCARNCEEYATHKHFALIDRVIDMAYNGYQSELELAFEEQMGFWREVFSGE